MKVKIIQKFVNGENSKQFLKKQLFVNLTIKFILVKRITDENLFLI